MTEANKSDQPLGLASTDVLGARLPGAQVVEILPTRVWIEDDLMGARHVMLQHEGFHAFCYASFNYDYAYTSNAGTHAAAHELARRLGAAEPIETKLRDFHFPTADELRKEIKLMQDELERMEQGA